MPELYIVTGASAGLGLHAALSLAAGGGTLVLTGRDAARLEAAAERARAAGAGADTTGVPLDLADLGSVSRFADDLEQRFPGRSIAALVLNAGINTPRFAWSADGIEATFATNHLGHFLLAQLLLPRMAPRGRVVITSSGTHDPAVKAPLPEPKWDELGEMAMLKEDLGGVPPPNYDGGLAYTRSKLCNIYMAYELARRLAAAGSRVTVTAYDPGFCPDTELSREMPRWVRGVFGAVIPIYMWLARSPQRPSTAAASGAFMGRLAADPEFEGVTGKYFAIDKEVPSSPASYDEAKQAELWRYSEQLVERLQAQAAPQAAAG